MATNVDPDIAQELQAAMRALEPHGFSLTATKGSGMMFTADFRSDKAFLQIVKDRGFWFLNGETDDLKRHPSRKSLGAVVRDALDWIGKNVT